MRKILFDGKHDVRADEILEKMNYYILAARKGMEQYKTDQKICLEITKKIRDELEKEYKNNNLKRIENFYEENKFFNFYRPAVHEAVASITGRMTNSNVYSFLYDVEDYMKYHLPKSVK